MLAKFLCCFCLSDRNRYKYAQTKSPTLNVQGVVADSVSRVLCQRHKPPSSSFIYDGSHLSPLAVYPSASGEQPLIADIHNLATHKTYCRMTSLPPRWALTPPFHPYPFGRLFSVTLLYPLEYQAVNLCGALCCSDFPPLFRAAMNRICAAKVYIFLVTAKKQQTRLAWSRVYAVT